MLNGIILSAVRHILYKAMPIQSNYHRHRGRFCPEILPV